MMIINKKYNEKILKIRNLITKKKNNKYNIEDLNKPVSFWFGKELFNNEQIESLTIILKTKGCYWAHHGGCSMCGYINDSSIEMPTMENFKSQLTFALDKIKNRVIIKIFTSGSFFDINEIPIDVRNKLFQILSEEEKILKISFETRPEFINEQLIKSTLFELKNKTIEFAYGIETSSDIIRIESINKGFLYSNFKNACILAKKYNILNKAYLLLKPPFLSEKEAFLDIIKSIDDIQSLVNTISINPCTIQKFTFIEKLWKQNEYDTPWLWTLIKILIINKKKYPNLIIISDPSALGSKRGIYNRCLNCNYEIGTKLKDFCLNQNILILEDINCNCEYRWKQELELGEKTFGSILKI